MAQLLQRPTPMTPHHLSVPESSRYPEPPQPFAHTTPTLGELEDLDTSPHAAPQPLHVDAEGMGGREATHRRVLTRSKLPMDVGQYTYVGGANEYRGETFAAKSQRMGEQSNGVSQVDVARAQQRTNEDEVRGEDAQADSGWVKTGVVFAAAGIGRRLLSRAATAISALALAGGALYLSRRKDKK
jgi:hypothetical protein